MIDLGKNDVASIIVSLNVVKKIVLNIAHFSVSLTLPYKLVFFYPKKKKKSIIIPRVNHGPFEVSIIMLKFISCVTLNPFLALFYVKNK